MRHEKLKELYEAERAINPDAFENWQFKANCLQPWVNLNGHPIWDEGFYYQRNPDAPPFVAPIKESRHAALMDQYLADWKKSSQPWKLWQEYDLNGKSISGPWTDLQSHPLWREDCDYRRKPETIKVNGFDVPKPLESLEGLDECCTLLSYPCFLCIDYAGVIHISKNTAKHLLKLGLLHLRHENAVIHAKAMLGIDPKIS